MRMRWLRSLAVYALWWTPVWGAIGAAVGIRLVVGQGAPVSDIASLAIVWAGFGAIAGSMFGLGLSIVAHGRAIERVSPVLSVAAASILAFLLGASVEEGYEAAVLFAVAAVICAAGSVLVARRGVPTSSRAPGTAGRA